MFKKIVINWLKITALLGLFLVNSSSFSYQKTAIKSLEGTGATSESQTKNTSRADSLIDINKGLVLYYPFNNNANDESGNENDGTVNGNEIAPDRFGNSRSAYRFNDSHYITNSTLFQEITDVFSICFWIKITEFGSELWANHISAANRWGAFTFHTMNDGSAYCGIEDWDNARFSSITDIPANTFKTNKWQFVVFTFDRGKARFYVDNKLIAKMNDMKSPRKSWDGIHIGRGSAITNINGFVDDLRVYDRALDFKTIQKLFFEKINANTRSVPMYERIQTKHDFASLTNFDIVHQNIGNIYVRNHTRLLKYDGIKWTIIDSNLSNNVEALGKDKDGKIYLSTINKVGYLDYLDGTQHFKILAESNDTLNIDFVFEIVDIKKRIYFINVHGVLQYESNQSSYYEPTGKEQVDYAFAYNEQLYLNLKNKGLCRLNNGKFNLVLNGDLIKNEKLVGSIAYSGGGHLILDEKGNTYLLKNNSLQLQEIYSTDIKNKIAANKPTCIVNYNEGLLIGTKKNGIYNIKNRALLGEVNQANGLNSNTVNDINVIGSYIWIATDNGITTINNLERWQFWPLHYDRDGIIRGITSYNNQLYVQTTKKLLKLEKNELITTHLADTTSIVFTRTVSDSLEIKDKNGNIWRVIRPEGSSDELQKLKQLEDNTYSITSKYSTLKDPFLLSIYPDPNEDNIIWIAGSQGLYRLDDNVGKGIETNIIQLSSNDSILYDNQFGKAYSDVNGFAKELRSLNFLFASLNGKEYSYRLVGNGNIWSAWTTKNEKEYTNLPAGEYSFEVKARNELGEEGKSSKYHFSILPKWYERTWLIYSLSFILIVIVFGVIMIYRQRFKAQKLIAEKEKLEREILEGYKEEITAINDQLHRANKSKETMLTVLSHDLRSPLVTMQTHLRQMQNTEMAESLTKSVEDTILLADQMLNWVFKKKDSLTVQRQAIEVDELIEEIKGQNELLIHDKKLNVVVHSKLNEAIISDLDIISTILRNTIGNAIKYAKTNSEVNIKCDYEDGKLFIVIANKITSTHKNGAGVGLNMSKELITLINGKISNYTQKSLYTTRIVLPLK